MVPGGESPGTDFGVVVLTGIGTIEGVQDFSFFNMAKLTNNFTLEELTRAVDSVDNTPGIAVQTNLVSLATYVLQPLRDAVGKPIVVHCGYRCPDYNRMIGGDPNSEHLYGLAADIDIPGMTNEEIVAKVKELKLPFQQIIDEQLYNKLGYLEQWIHISWSVKPARIVKTARNTKDNRKAVYTIIK